MLFPVIETERLILRNLIREDAPFILEQFSSPAVSQYLMDAPPINKIEEAVAIIAFYENPEEKGRNRWLILRKEDNMLLGTCGFHRWEKDYFRAEIGYDLTEPYWGKGYMSEALQAMLKNGFENMGLNRIDALVAVENRLSVNLLERFNFKREGILRDYFCLDGKFYDHFIFSLLKREWEER